MRREVRLLRERAINSLILAIELFNRPRDEGRTEAALIHADHAFEMLLKAAIRHKGGRIRNTGETHTIGFKACVNKCVSDPQVRCLSADQSISLFALNGWRDAAQHYLLDLGESELYLAIQGAVTLFDDVLTSIFGEHLSSFMPDRVLPVSTRPPTDLTLLLESEFDLIKTLSAPGTRRLAEAKARLRPVTILEAASQGEDTQPPSEGELRRAIQRIRGGEEWRSIFPGVAALQLDTDGSGLTYSLRLTKREGPPVRIVDPADPDAVVIGSRRVNELDFYQFNFTQLHAQLGGIVSRNRLPVVIRALRLTDDPKYYKLFKMGESPFGRYSQEAAIFLRREILKLDLDQLWQEELARRREAREVRRTSGG